MSAENWHGSGPIDRFSRTPLTAARQFGHALRTARKRQGLSQRALYAKSLVHYSIINRLESGKITPTTGTATALDDALNAKGALVELARAARTEPSAGLPPPPLHFVGRAQPLETLTELLPIDPNAMHQRSRVVFVCGAPGIGKTALARFWANANAHRFDQVLHADLHGFGLKAPAEPADILESLLHGLGVRSDRLPHGSELRLAMLQGLLEQRQSVGQRVLIVLDNARDSRHVKQILPGTPNTSVLVTSRNWLAGLAIETYAKGIRLRPLDRPEATELVTGFIGRVHADSEPDAVARLVELCGLFPVALTIAAERVAANDLKSIQEHVDELAERGALDLHAEDDEAVRVRATFRWSYQSLDLEQARMFRLIGLLPGPGFSAASAGALAGLSAPAATRLLDQLQKRSLLEQVAADTFQVHDLLRLYAVEEADRAEWSDERRAAARGRRPLDAQGPGAPCKPPRQSLDL